jgi:hypothetical protein
MMRGGDGTKVADVLESEALSLGALAVEEVDLAGGEALLVEPEQEAAVGRVLGSRLELDAPAGGAVDDLLAVELRRGVVLRPVGDLRQDLEVAIAEVGADEALVAELRRDLTGALELSTAGKPCPSRSPARGRRRSPSPRPRRRAW